MLRVTSIAAATATLLAVLGTNAVAAVPASRQESMVPVPSSKAALMRATKEALRMPIGERIETLQQQGPQGYRNLVGLMMDDAQPMETRWKAVTSVGLIGRAESKPELERALKHNEWYMRNAGLVAMVGADRASASRWAKALLSDKAAIVRAAAVDAIVEMRDTSSKELLWKKLYAKENFRHGKSLFVRKRILEALTHLEGPGREQKFVQILSDKDESLHPYAIAALEKITNQSLGANTEPTKIRRELWQKWWKEKAQAKL